MHTGTPLLALVLLLGPGPSPGLAETDPRPDCPRPVLRDGERLFYRATAWKGFIVSDVGTATLFAHRQRAGAVAGWRLVARAQGDSFGHTLDAHVVSRLDPAGERCVEYAETQQGSSPGGRRLAWEGDALVYHKLKHCPGCEVHAHFDGDAHCDDHRCGNVAHDVWRVRHRHAVDATVSDPLAALYRARALDLRVGGPDHVLRICAGHGIFDVTVRATKAERCTVPAGTFDALRLELIPAPACGTPRSARFTGLFGLSGTVTVLVDAATKIPLRITGVVPMGVDVNCEVELTAIQAPAAMARPH
jgi:hypothetical protein